MLGEIGIVWKMGLRPTLFLNAVERARSDSYRDIVCLSAFFSTPLGSPDLQVSFAGHGNGF